MIPAGITTDTLEERRKLPFLAAGVVMMITMKAMYTMATQAQLSFLLAPVSFLVSLFQTAHYTLIPEEGYLFPALDMIIDGSCAGGNFLILSFGIIGFACIQELKSAPRNWLLFVPILGASWLATVISNVARINLIILTRSLDDTYPWISSAQFHEIQGIMVYLSALICVYVATRHIIHKTTTGA